jgi:hypothetical protein
MNSAIANGFQAGAGFGASNLRLLLLAVLGGLAFAFAMWLVSQVMEAYRSNELEVNESIVSLAYVALLCVLIVAVLGWA